MSFYCVSYRDEFYDELIEADDEEEAMKKFEHSKNIKCCAQGLHNDFFEVEEVDKDGKEMPVR